MCSFIVMKDLLSWRSLGSEVHQFWSNLKPLESYVLTWPSSYFDKMNLRLSLGEVFKGRKTTLVHQHLPSLVKEHCPIILNWALVAGCVWGSFAPSCCSLWEVERMGKSWFIDNFPYLWSICQTIIHIVLCIIIIKQWKYSLLFTSEKSHSIKLRCLTYFKVFDLLVRRQKIIKLSCNR